MAKECDQPRNPATIKCRNCDEMGHASRDCTAPKDWSRVKCSNCEEMGHTYRRCKQPPKEEAGELGEDNARYGVAADTGAPAPTNVSGAGTAEWNTSSAQNAWETPATAAPTLAAAGGW